MTNIKMFIINAVLAAGVGALMQLVWALIVGLDYLTLGGVVNMMITSIIVGSVSLFCIFKVILKFNTNLKKAVVINVFIMILLLVAIYVQSGIIGSYWIIDMKWLVILILSQAAGISLTILWYRQIKNYSSKLEMKKASLRENK